MSSAKDWNAGMAGQADAKDQALSKQARLVSIVIAGTMIIWMAAQWLGGKLELPQHYVFLVDLFALAGFLWALIVTFQIWRKRRAHG
ncbi:MAG: DUF5337 domain-containing protein [Paracoccaceae bacterium]